MVLINIRPTRPVTLDDFLEDIFPGQRTRHIAKIILNEASTGISMERIKALRDEYGTTTYAVLRRMKKLGMVQKRGGHRFGKYYLSSIFATYLADRAQFWRDYVSVARDRNGRDR